MRSPRTSKPARSAPNAPRVTAAYAQLAAQTDAMFTGLTHSRRGAALRIAFTRSLVPYSGDRELIDAVRSERVLEVTIASRDPDRLHPLLDCSPGGAYDRFRAVHDVLGHVAPALGFDRDGEYAAWLIQDRHYHGLPRCALATELHGEHSVRWTSGKVAEHKATLLHSGLLRRAARGRSGARESDRRDTKCDALCEHPPSNEIGDSAMTITEQLRTRLPALDPRRRQRNDLVETHVDLAFSVARQFSGRGEELDDLRQVALLALVQAAERFDPSRGFAFSTFAVPTITGALKRHFRDHAWAVRPPRRLQEQYIEVAAIIEHLTGELHRFPTTAEVAAHGGWSESDVRNRACATRVAVRRPLGRRRPQRPRLPECDRGQLRARRVACDARRPARDARGSRASHRRVALRSRAEPSGYRALRRAESDAGLAAPADEPAHGSRRGRIVGRPRPNELAASILLDALNVFLFFPERDTNRTVIFLPMSGEDAAHDYGSDIYTEADGSDDTLANLGPLRALAGVWTSAEGADVHPVGAGSDITGPVVDGDEHNVFVERYELQPIDPQTNGPQLFYGLRYHTHIVKPGEVETFHDQVGYWLWEPAARTVLHTLGDPARPGSPGDGHGGTGRHRVRGQRDARLRGERHRVEPVPRPGLPHGQLPHARHGPRRRNVVVRGAHHVPRSRPRRFGRSRRSQHAHADRRADTEPARDRRGMTQPLEGFRILEVDNWGFSPSAGAVLADWGADIVKVEPPGHGDPLRAIFGALNFAPGALFNFMYEQWNRNKRSIALDLTTTDGRAVLDELIGHSDVFLTNYLPDLRAKLRLTAADVRTVRPDIVYALATGQGSKGPDAAKPSYDYVSAWARAGVGERLTPDGAPFIQQRAGIVDTTAGNFLAGAIAAALLRRERSGGPVDVEVSLLAAGGWIVGPDIAFALNNDFEMPHNRPDGRGAGPLFTWYECADGRRLVFTMMQPERYWPEVARVLELEHVLSDARFDTPEKRMAETDALCAVVADRIRTRPRDEWAAVFDGAQVIWGPVQSPNEFAEDAQVVANGYILDAPRPDGSAARLMSSPAQFDQEPTTARWAAPDIGQHTDEVLAELGWDAGRIAAAKASGFAG